MDREKIIKALELCLANDVCGSSCEICPYIDHRGSCMDDMMRDALSLIKELAEDEEMLYRTLDDKIQECEKWKWRLPIECNYTKKITVQKVKLMLAVHFGTYKENDTVKIKDLFRLLDRFTEEMIE